MANLHLGQTVRNFGFTATVIGFNKITGDPILQDIRDRRKWLADAAKCEPAGETVLKHKNGLICFG
mgnify:FL=1